MQHTYTTRDIIIALALGAIIGAAITFALLWLIVLPLF
jgi:hypothetical protein